jgi:uncharacterized OB-fold protein
MYCTTVGCPELDACVACYDATGDTLCEVEVLDTLDTFTAVYVSKRRVLDENMYYSEVL